MNSAPEFFLDLETDQYRLRNNASDEIILLDADP